jgi:hypothetical protein
MAAISMPERFDGDVARLARKTGRTPPERNSGTRQIWSILRQICGTGLQCFNEAAPISAANTPPYVVTASEEMMHCCC